MADKITTLVPPGAAIKELLVRRGMTQKDFAERMDLSQKHVSHLINGDVQLTPEVAYRLEMVLGVPAEYWNGLEASYREALVRAEHEKDVLEDMKLLKMLPLAELKSKRWVELADAPAEQVIQLRKYFEVSKLEILLRDRFEDEGLTLKHGQEEFLSIAQAQHEKWLERERVEKALDKAEQQAKTDPTRLSHEEVFGAVRKNLRGKQNA